VDTSNYFKNGATPKSHTIRKKIKINIKMKNKILLSLLLLSISLTGFCTVWTVNNSGNTFTPATITINFGDTVNFVIAVSHDAREVSQTTWNASGNTALAGGFQTPFGGGMVLPAQLGVGTHYYVCTPHASLGMKAIIIVQSCPIPATPNAISGNITVCSASSNTYGVSAVSVATSYTWTLPGGWTGTSTTNSIATTASSTSGNITVSANNACGSSAPQTLAVTVNTVPAIPNAINGNTTVCSTSSNSYSVSAVSGATDYTWTLPNGWSGTSTTTSITATASTSSGNITVTANNSCGSSVAQTLTITVNSSIPAAPGVISGNATVCEASLNTYNITAVSGATDYTWTLPVGWTGSSTTNSISTVAGATGGNITVSANNSCGSSAPSTLSLTVSGGAALSQPGTISGNATVCPTSSNTYNTTAVSGATDYTWTLPGGWTGTSTTTSISALAGITGGNITVSANNSCGSSAPQTLNVSVNLIDTSVSLSGTILTANISGAAYEWINCSTNAIIAGQNSQSYNATANGNYAVIITQSSCSDTSSCYSISTVGITENSLSPFVFIYPNPSDGKFQFTIEGEQIAKNCKVEIYNVQGERIYQSEITNTKSDIDLSNQTNGIYFMKIYNEQTVLTKKIVID
jgi:plastocyanin